MKNAMMIDPRDNVVVAIEEIKRGGMICYAVEGEERLISALENIQIYHKAAIKDIAYGKPIIKYGEHIGTAACDIKAGEYVHEHNVKSLER